MSSTKIILLVAQKTSEKNRAWRTSRYLCIRTAENKFKMSTRSMLALGELWARSLQGVKKKKKTPWWSCSPIPVSKTNGTTYLRRKLVFLEIEEIRTSMLKLHQPRASLVARKLLRFLQYLHYCSFTNQFHDYSVAPGKTPLCAKTRTA